MKKTRRTFLHQSGLAAGAGLFWLYGWGGNTTDPAANNDDPQPSDDSPGTDLFFDISLAQWSLHQALGIRGNKTMDNLDFAATARNQFDIGAVEYVSQFFKDKATDEAYLAEMVKRANDHDVKNLLIMVDGEGGLGETDAKQRRQAVENHYKWIHAAQALGCHSIRVNAFSSNPDPKEAAQAAVDGLGELATYAQQNGGINVIVENHGGFSSNGAWLSGVMKTIDMENCGTLPDFGNFCVRRDNGKEWGGNCIEEYDRYQGVRELMPYAKGVSAKSHDFNEAGEEIHTDYRKMLQIVKDAGYRGYIGVEYEGSELSEEEGIRKTKDLLQRVGAELS